MLDEKHFQIGEVAELIGLSIPTIRHYGELGIVRPSARSTGGFRLSTQADVARFLLIKPFKPLGLNTDEVCRLIETLDELAATPSLGRRGELIASLSEFINGLQRRCDDLRLIAATGEASARALTGELFDAAGNR